MDMMIDALNKATSANTAFSTFEELCQAGIKGYSPTFGHDQRSIGAAFDARMNYEGCPTRTTWANWR